MLIPNQASYMPKENTKIIFIILVVIIYIICAIFISMIDYKTTINALTIELISDQERSFRLYYDTGNGYNEQESVDGEVLRRDKQLTTYHFSIPHDKILIAIRIDPDEQPSRYLIKSVSLNYLHDSKRIYPHLTWNAEQIEKLFIPLHNVKPFSLQQGYLLVETEGTDPYFATKENLFEMWKQLRNEQHPFLLPSKIVGYLLLSLMATIFFFYRYVLTRLQKIIHLLSKMVISGFKKVRYPWFKTALIVLIILFAVRGYVILTGGRLSISEYYLFFFSHFGYLFLFVIFSYHVGHWIVKKIPLDEQSERFFFHTAIGLGLIICFLFLLALFHFFSLAIIVSFFFLASSYLIYFKISISRNHVISFPSTNYFGWINILLFFLVIPLLVPSLYPPTAWDEISYHLAYARHYAENQGLNVNPYLRYPLYAHNINLLYALCLLIYDDILSHLIHAMMAVLTTLGIYNLGESSANKRIGFAAALIFISSPLVIHLMKTSYIDLGLTLFLFLGFFCIIKWTQSRNIRWLYVAGFATGIAIGSKYSGFLYFILFSLWIATEKNPYKPLLCFIVFATLFGLPWYIRNMIISGDPFSPFGGNIFGYWIWDKSDLIGQTQDLLKAHGTPRSLSSLIKLPWNLIENPSAFMEGAISLPMASIPLSLILLFKFNHFYRKLTVFVFLNILIWFYSSQILRYLLPVFPMISLLAATVIIHLCDIIIKPLTFVLKSSWLTFIRNGIVLTVLLLIATPLISTYSNIIRNLMLIPIPVQEIQRYQYLVGHLSGYELLMIANRNAGLRIYQFGFENLFYYSKNPLIGDWFGLGKYSKVLNELSNPDRLHKALREMNTDLFLFNKKRGFKLEYNESFAPYFKIIAETESAILMRILAP